MINTYSLDQGVRLFSYTFHKKHLTQIFVFEDQEKIFIRAKDFDNITEDGNSVPLDNKS